MLNLYFSIVDVDELIPLTNSFAQAAQRLWLWLKTGYCEFFVLQELEGNTLVDSNPKKEGEV